MELEQLQHVDRQTWRRYLFYMDLAVFAIFAVSLSLLVRHTFEAGQLFNQGEFGLANRTMWQIVTETAFLVGSFSWIAYRFFRNEYIVMTRRF